MKYATLGTVSHGTLRTEDLIDSFADTLESLVSENGAANWQDLEAERGRCATLIDEARAWLDSDTSNPNRNDDYDSDEARDDAGIELVRELGDALNEFAPPYAHFGAHEGDGSDFGYWISEDIDELVAGPMRGTELPCPHCSEEGVFLLVNERGNMELYERRLTHGSFETDNNGPIKRIAVWNWVSVWSAV